MSHRISTFLLLSALILTAGCDVNGTPGPSGRRGPRGPAGETTTNVYTENFRFYLSDATRQEDDFNAYVDYDLDLPASIVDNGAVFLYYRAYGTWTAMPSTAGVEAPDDPPRVDFTATLGYSYDIDFLEVYLEGSTADDAVWEDIAQLRNFFTEEGIGDPDGIRMKAVLLEDLAAGKKEVDFSDYDEVARAYGLD